MKTFFQWLMQTPVTIGTLKAKPKAAKPKRTKSRKRTKRTKDGYSKR